MAHHPLAGKPMEIFAHGLLSDIRHPVLGIDYFFFIALVGTQCLLAIAAGKLILRLGKIAATKDITTRLSGAAVAGVGVYLLLMVDGVVVSVLI